MIAVGYRVRGTQKLKTAPPSSPSSTRIRPPCPSTTRRAIARPRPTRSAVGRPEVPRRERITPGAHDMSLIWLMSHRRDDDAMPPRVSHKVDEPGTQALSDWIDALQ